MSDDDELPLWECNGCGATRRCNVLAHDDWGGTVRAIGPDCPECDVAMDFVEDPADCDEDSPDDPSEYDVTGAGDQP